MPKDASQPKPSRQPKPERPFPVLLHVAEVAQTLRCSPSTVHRLCEMGELPSLKVGPRRLIAKSDFWAFLRRVRAQSLQSPEVSPTPQDTLPAPDFDAEGEDESNESTDDVPAHLRPRKDDAAALAFFSQTDAPAR